MRTTLLFIYLFFSKAGITQPDFRKGDSLEFKLKVIDSSHDSQVDSSIKVFLKYDFKYQYPYYSLSEYELNTGSKIQLQFLKLPKKGTIYICTIDSYSTIIYRGSIDLSNRLDSSLLIIPSEFESFDFKRKGNAALILWYSNKGNINAQDQMERMELTLGSYVKRNCNQIGKKLLLPKMNWQLSENGFGLIMDFERFGFPKEFVVPIIIEAMIN
jgi:hypothetical protein